MSAARFLLPALLAAVLGAGTAQARLGDNLDDLRKLFGKPVGQPRKESAFWLIEGSDGLLNYTVTFNAEGRSIAEGLKPVKRARFTEDDARGFMDSQLQPWRDSPTLRIVKAGEQYQFAGKDLVCAKNEEIAVDDANSLLIIWTKATNVVVVSAEMLQQVK